MPTKTEAQAAITGLTSGTKYYFRAKAVGDGTAYGAEMSFVAGQSSSTNNPVVTTSSAINITSSSFSLFSFLVSLSSKLGGTLRL
jgi:hypothetical protein